MTIAAATTPAQISLVRLVLVRQGIDMWRKFGMIPTRGITITKLLKMATEATGNKYKKSPAEYERAAREVQEVIDAAHREMGLESA